MAPPSGDKRRRRKKRNDEKFEETALHSLWQTLFGGDVSRKRKRSRSSNSSASSIDRSLRSHHRDKNERRRRHKRRTKSRTSSHRRRSRSNVSRISGEDKSPDAAKELKLKQVKSSAIVPLKKKRDDLESNGIDSAKVAEAKILQVPKQDQALARPTRGQDVVTVGNTSKEATEQQLLKSTNEAIKNAGSKENMVPDKVSQAVEVCKQNVGAWVNCQKVGEACSEKSASSEATKKPQKTIEIAAGPTETVKDTISRIKDVSTEDKESKNSTRKEEIMVKMTKDKLLIEPKTIQFHPKNVSKPAGSSKEIVQAPTKPTPDAAIQDAKESLKESNKANDETAEKSLKISQTDARQESLQAEYTNLINSWKSIVTHGLSTSANAELLLKHCPSEDSQGFQAPILNPGLKSLLNGVQIVRDDAEIFKQNQLGASIRAIYSVANRIVIGNQRSSDLARIVVTMNDAACIIAEVHYSASIARRKRVVQALGIEKFVIVGFVGETLFSRKEETEIREKIAEARLLKKMNEEVEKRLAAAKKEESERTKDNEAECQLGNEETEECDAPCSQRFGASRHSKLTIVRAKPEGGKKLKSEEKIKPENLTKALKRLLFQSKAIDETSKFPGFVEMTKMARIRQGFPEIAIPVVMNVLAPSTSKSYEKHLEKWWDFSQRETVDAFDPRMHDVMEFFTENWLNGATVSSLNTARSALAWITSKDLGKNEDLGMLFRGFAKKCI